MYIRGRGIIGYLTGEIKMTVKTDASYSTWDAENSLIMSWLVNSIDEEITKNWQDPTRGDSITKYINVLKGLWQDLDLFNEYEWKIPDDCNHNKKMVKNARIFKFLVGLNDKFDEVRGRILSRQPWPPTGEVFSEVRHEGCCRNVMLKRKGTDGAVENSALTATNSNNPNTVAVANASAQGPYSTQRKYEKKSRVWCDYYNKPRQT
ncbi:hypothetical protein I3760_12G034300 [Carya illinoinensis]|nr:hypothetical protein I3760_12G034300 [Carya illinoinensis]